MKNTDFNHFQLKGVYAITDPELLQEERLIPAVLQALKGGASVIQYRDKKNSSIDRKRNAQSLASCCHDFSVPLIINDDVQLCKSVCAAGVHIGQSDTPLQIARSELGSDAIIGVTCHDNLALAIDAWKNQATYIALGRFFSSTTKANASVCNISVIKQVKSQINCPIVTIGGINLDTAHSLINEGTDMIALCQGLFGAKDIRAEALALKQLFTTYQDA